MRFLATALPVGLLAVGAMASAVLQPEFAAVRFLDIGFLHETGLVPTHHIISEIHDPEQPRRHSRRRP